MYLREDFIWKHYILPIVILLVMRTYTFMNTPALVLSVKDSLFSGLTRAGLCIFPAVLVLCIALAKPNRTRCWPQTSLLMLCQPSWSSLSCKSVLYIIINIIDTPLLVYLYILWLIMLCRVCCKSMSQTMVLIFCMTMQRFQGCWLCIERVATIWYRQATT